MEELRLNLANMESLRGFLGIAAGQLSSPMEHWANSW